MSITQTYSYNAIGNFITKAGVTQVYSTTQPHAVRSLSDGSSFQYDANGNMTQRTEMSGTQLVTYQQKWDIDNRLVVVTNTTTSQVTQYFYDADGNRVKRISPQGTIVYVNTDYEVTGPSQMVAPPSTLPPTYTHKLYLPVVSCAGCNGIPSLNEPLLNLAAARVTYRFNGQQVAVREGVTLTFVYGDHLGSASVTVNISGTKVSEARYYPFGETRYSSGTLPSGRTFTGQRTENQNAVGNLMDYGARFYSPILGRFISADSIIRTPDYPQDINRYNYARNNPVKNTDPSGHFCIPCAAALGGAIIGASVDLAHQLIVDQKNINQVDWGSVAGSAVSGAVFGFTMGLVAPVGIGATLVAGAGAGTISGIAGRTTRATWDEVDNLFKGQGFDGHRLLDRMSQEGVLDIKYMTIDAATGTLSAGLGWALTKVLVKANVMTDPALKEHLGQVNDFKTITWNVKDKSFGYTSNDANLTITQSDFIRLVSLIEKNAIKEAIDFATEIIGQQTQSKLEEQVK